MGRSLQEKRADFRKLHESGCFVIPNPWDIGSARMLQSMGFKALATTSSGYAWTQGHADGSMGRDEVLAHLRVISSATDLPVNADFEAGYAKTAEGVGESVRMAIDTGVSGLSIEDSTYEEKNPLRSIDEAGTRMRARQPDVRVSRGARSVKRRSVERSADQDEGCPAGRVRRLARKRGARAPDFEQGIRRPDALFEERVEVSHVRRRRAVLDFPEAHDDPSRAGGEEGLGQADDALAANPLTERRVACRQRDEVGGKREALDLGQSQTAARKKECRLLRLAVADLGVRREVQVPESGGFEASPSFGRRLGAEEEPGACAVEEPDDFLRLLLREGKRSAPGARGVCDVATAGRHDRVSHREHRARESRGPRPSAQRQED